MGIIAALGAAAFWAIVSIIYSIAGKRVGALVVNRTRLLIGLFLIMITHTVLYGSPLPGNASWQRWLWLGLSGAAGLGVGDSLHLQAYLLIGPRLGTLFISFVPVISTLLAWVFLGERLQVGSLAGIVITVAGIALVVLEHGENGGAAIDRRTRVSGILFGVGAATFQAAGFVFARQGLAGDFPSLSGVVIRMLMAVVSVWLVALLAGQVPHTIQALVSDKIALNWIALSSVLGPFLGVWCILLSLQLLPVGISSTLTGLAPVIMLPLSGLLFKEKITSRAIFGTLISIGGVALLLLS